MGASACYSSGSASTVREHMPTAHKETVDEHLPSDNCLSAAEHEGM